MSSKHLIALDFCLAFENLLFQSLTEKHHNKNTNFEQQHLTEDLQCSVTVISFCAKFWVVVDSFGLLWLLLPVYAWCWLALVGFLVVLAGFG